LSNIKANSKLIKSFIQTSEKKMKIIQTFKLRKNIFFVAV